MKSYQALDGFHPRPSDNSIGWGPWKSWVRFPEEKSPDYISGHNRQTQPRRLFSDTGIIWIENTLHTFYSNFLVCLPACGPVCVDTSVSVRVRVCAPFLRRDLKWDHTTHILFQLLCASVFPCVWCVCGHWCFWTCTCLCAFSQTWFELRTHYTHSTPTSLCVSMCGVWTLVFLNVCVFVRIFSDVIWIENTLHTFYANFLVSPCVRCVCTLEFLHVPVWTCTRLCAFSQTWF